MIIISKNCHRASYYNIQSYFATKLQVSAVVSFTDTSRLLLALCGQTCSWLLCDEQRIQECGAVKLVKLEHTPLLSMHD